VIRGYILRDTTGKEAILVLRTEEIGLLHSVVENMKLLNDDRLSRIADSLEGELRE